MEMTWKQVCDAAKINESTGRFYKEKFKQYFSHSGVGRHKKYSQESIAQLLLIAELYGKGLDASQVMCALEAQYGIPISSQDKSSSTYAVQQSALLDNSSTYAVQQEEFVAAIRQVFQEELAKRDELIIELQKELTSVKDIVVSMEQKAEEFARTATDSDREVMEEIRKVQAVQQQQNSRAWWKRLFGR